MATIFAGGDEPVVHGVITGALADIRAGIGRRRIWMALAAEEIGDQHRRTILGPLWLLINYLAFAGTFIFVFSPGGAGPAYATYVATGLVVWFYIMETITLGVGLFGREASFIRGTTLPLTVYVMRSAVQSMIRAAYALAGCIAILLLTGVAITPAWAWSALGVLLVLAATPATITVFAFAGAFFPDSQFIVGNLMRIGMFVTPVFWSHAGEGGLRTALYDYNPFTYFLDIVRVPIVDGSVPLTAFGVCFALMLTMWALAILLLGKLRRQVALVI